MFWRLRTAANHSGRQLAELLSWPASKISKLENGHQTPSDDDIRAWTRATSSEAETEALLASLHTLEVQHAEWRRILHAGIRPRQNELADLDQQTKLFRVFESTVISGLLQTAEYARLEGERWRCHNCLPASPSAPSVKRDSTAASWAAVTASTRSPP